MAKLKLSDSPSKPTKREYTFSDLSFHSGMFKGMDKFTIGEEVTLQVTVKINNLRLADSWEQTEYKGITKDTEFARGQIMSVKKV